MDRVWELLLGKVREAEQEAVCLVELGAICHGEREIKAVSPMLAGFARSGLAGEGVTSCCW